ncbi:transcriptional regulator [Penicillium cf. viridicatum]|uniref:Transcriptional regulator n=1 Tax=Penicillium cf. viridicatum TaxID=2972119 RepID=A0A9W9IWE6_9EURO|nr:transcriptional regulator [Penicillium cf. viridicatum]
MYLRNIHAESHIPTLRQFMRDHPLGTLTTAITSSEYPFLQTSHIPGVELKDEVLVLFTGPVHHYVSPKFYTDTKPTTGKVVPTWNYAAVQAYGRATVYFDSGEASTDYLSQQISDLSQHAETAVMGYTGGDKQGPWKVSDAPDRYIAIMQKAIIGIKIDITRLGGKFKMSQEMGEKDRAGVIDGFESLGTEVGAEAARMVAERQELMKGVRS